MQASPLERSRRQQASPVPWMHVRRRQFLYECLEVRMVVTLMLTTVPDAAVAQSLADGALAARLAACVSELGALRSSYRWQGKIETAHEIQLLFKTSPFRAPELEQFILSHHPYDTPEIVAWQATASPAYGQWVATETQHSFHV